jgi:hypothetical protein
MSTTFFGAIARRDKLDGKKRNSFCHRDFTEHISNLPYFSTNGYTALEQLHDA